MGKNKEVTVGFRYFLGMHAVLCQAPIDGLLEIEFGDRSAWRGFANNKRISVYANELFGGKAREGGVSGFIDVQGGGSDQGTNDYLQGRLRGGLVPAFRGVFGLVFRRFYFGNNPYIKPWRAKVLNVFATYQQWLPDLAPINPEVYSDKTAIYIALDNSISMTIGSRLPTMKGAVNQLLDSIADSPLVAIKIVSWSGAVDGTREYFGWTASKRAEAKAFVNSILGNGSGTDFRVAVSQASAFFTAADNNIDIDGGTVNAYAQALVGDSSGSDPLRRVVVLVTDGEPAAIGATAQQITDGAVSILNGIANKEVFGFNIDLTDTTFTAQLDSDGSVPVIESGEEDKMASAFQASFSSFCDLNPAHILRDLLIAPTSDGDGDSTSIGTSFATAAQTLFDEGFGLSIFWNNPSEKDAFKRVIEQHIDGVAYRDHTTGKWELKLIRPDFTVGTLFTYNRDNIVEWVEAPERPKQHELPNQITVEYTRRDNGQPASVTLTNVAAVQVVGRVTNEKVSMPGITWPRLANKVAQRELVSRTQPLTKGAIRVAYVPATLNLGSAFILNEPRVRINNMVCRVIEIEESDGKDNSVVIRFAQDVFVTNPVLEPIAEDDFVAPPSFEALPPNVQLTQEIPYYTLVLNDSQVDVDNDLAVDPDLGFWMATTDNPGDDHINLKVAQFQTPNWIEVAATTFAPTWRLRAFMDGFASTTTFSAVETGREAEVAAGTIIQIDDEMMRIDSISVSNGIATFTVGRGILDTVPAKHDVDAFVIAWDDFFATDLTQYTAGENVQLRLLPSTISSTYALNLADTQTVTFDSRAIRPYPVGNLRVEGSYDPGLVGSVVTATWAHRDRTIQTTLSIADHTAGNIGPEPGVSYSGIGRVLSLHDDVFDPVDFFSRESFFTDEVNFVEVTYDDFSPEDVTTYDFDLTLLDVYVDDRTIAYDIGVKTERGSPAYENWQTPFVRVTPLLAPINLEGEDLGGGASTSSSPPLLSSPSVERVAAFRYRSNGTQAVGAFATVALTLFDTEVFNQLGGTVVDPSNGRFEVPAGYDDYILRITASTRMSFSSSFALIVERSTDGGSGWGIVNAGRTAGGLLMTVGAAIKVNSGDLFRVLFFNPDGSAVTIEDDPMTFFSGVLFKEGA